MIVSLALCLCVMTARAQTPASAPVAASTAAVVAPPDPYADALRDIKSTDALRRRRGASTLGELRRQDAVPVLLDLLDDSDASVRSAAADSLGLLRTTSAVSLLSQLLAKDKDDGVRQSAATALAYIGHPQAVDALIAAVSDPAPGVRYSAARTLGAMRA